MKLRRVLFRRREEGEADEGAGKLWDVELVDGVVTSIAASESVEDNDDDDDDDSNMASQLLLPPLCHPHLHLDKAYLLTGGCCSAGAGHPNRPEMAGDAAVVAYDDLVPRTGSFAEALATTAAAKARFTAADLHRRGAQLLATAWRHGVTAARVFVEVDAGAAGGGRVALAAAAALRHAWRGRVAVQVCAFAQEPLLSGAAGAQNRAALEAVLADPALVGGVGGIAALGTAPYVEATPALALANLDWAVATALRHGLHLDLHLDYTLATPTADAPPLVWALLDALVRHRWTARAAHDTHGRPRTVAVGHATQLTRLPAAALQQLAATIRARGLPVALVGLPMSDVYMMGREMSVPITDPITDTTTVPPPPPPIPRGTLDIPALGRLGLRACLGVNNVGNAFTPHGTADPLLLACWGVGLYYAGTPADARQLYGAVSWEARAAIGMQSTDESDDSTDHRPWWDEKPSRLLGRHIGPVLVLRNERRMRLLSGDVSLPPLPVVPARARTGFRDVVWDPPDAEMRRIV